MQKKKLAIKESTVTYCGDKIAKDKSKCVTEWWKHADETNKCWYAKQEEEYQRIEKQLKDSF